MARRWRIRHKLMLGLATAIAILAMLLAGTLNGLWSYYVTMKSIDSKLLELDEAEKLKAAVSDLAIKATAEREKPEEFVARVFKLRDTLIANADRALDEFADAFQKTLDRDLTTDDGAHIKGLVDGLRTRLVSFRAACTIPDLEEVGFGDPHKRFEALHKNLMARADDLERTSADLRGAIRDNLKERISKSRRHYQFTLSVLIVTSTMGLLFMLSALRFFYGWIFNPVRDLQQGVHRLAQGDFEKRIEVHSGDEMEELAEAFNDMTCRLRDLYRDMATQINERSRQLVRSERLASVGFLAAGVAHEINNPLASIAFCSEALEARLEQFREESEGRDLDVFSRYLKMIQEEAFRCKKITERLLEVSRNSESKRERTDLAALVQAVLEVTQHHPKSKNKDIVVEPSGPVVAWVCAEEIKSVVINLIFNALESMDEGGRLTIELRQRDGMAELLFHDTGCGMTQEVLENIFEPFFTRSRSGKGTGLGLTITHKIVGQHGGEITADSPGADQGSTFRVRLPVQPVDAAKEETLGYNAAA